MKTFIQHLSLIAAFVLASVGTAWSADYYWVGGHGNWSQHGSHWATTSGGSVFHAAVPSPLDKVIFDGNSFPSGGTVIADVNMFCSEMVWTSAANGAAFFNLNGKILTVGGDLTISSDIYIQSGGTVDVAGDVTINPSSQYADIYGGTWYVEGSFDINANTRWNRTVFFDGTGTETIKTNGVFATGTFEINNGGTYTLQDDLKVGAFNLMKGTLKTGGNNVDFGWRFYAYYSNANCTLDATGTDTLEVDRNWQVYNNLSSINLIIDSTATILMRNPGHNHVYFDGGGKTYPNLFIDHNTANNGHTIYIRNNNSFKDVTVKMASRQYLRSEGVNTYGDVEIDYYYNSTAQNWSPHIQFWNNNTMSSFKLKHNSAALSPTAYFYGSNNFGDFTIDGWNLIYLYYNQTHTMSSLTNVANCKKMPLLYSAHGTIQSTISIASGTVNLTGAQLQSIKTAGGATFNTTNTIDRGNNTGWNFGAVSGNTYYWIGNTGNWSDPANWSSTSGGTAGTCLPRPIDNVVFDANSFSGTNQYCNLTQHVEFNDMTWDANVPTGSRLYGGYQLTAYGDVSFAGPMTFQQWSNLILYGSIEVATTVNWSQGGHTYLRGNKTGNTIDMGGKTFGANIYLDGLGGGEWKLTSNAKLNSNREFYMLNGIFRTNGYSMDFGQRMYGWYNSTNQQATLDFSGTDTVHVGWRWEVYPNSYMNVINASNTAFIMDRYSGGDHMYFRGGQHSYGDVVMKHLHPSTTHTMYMDYGDTFNNVYFYSASSQRAQMSNTNQKFNNVLMEWANNTNYNGQSYAYVYGRNGNNVEIKSPARKVLFYPTYSNGTWNKVTVSGGSDMYLHHNHTINLDSLILNGSCDAPINLYTNSATATSTINMGSGAYISTNYVYLQGVKATGGASFIANNSLDLGNNTGWTINSFNPQTLYWIGGTGSFSDASHWSLTSGGSAQVCAPTLSDTVIFDSNSFTSGGGVVTLDKESTVSAMFWDNGVQGNPTFTGNVRLDILNFLGIDGKMTWSQSGANWLYGSIRGNADVTWNHTNWWYFSSDDTTNTIDMNGMPTRSLFSLRSKAGNTNPVWTMLSELNHINGTFNMFRAEIRSNGNTVRARDLNGWDWGSYNYRSIWDFRGTDTIFIKNRVFIHPNGGTRFYMDSTATIYANTEGGAPSMYFYFGDYNAELGNLYVDYTYPYNPGWRYHYVNFYKKMQNVNFNLSSTLSNNTGAYHRVQFDGGNTTVQTYKDVEINFNGTEMQLYTRSNRKWGDITMNSTQSTGWFRWWAEPLTADTITLAPGSDNQFYNTVKANHVQVNQGCNQRTLRIYSGTLEVDSGNTVSISDVELNNTKAQGGATFNASNAQLVGTVTGWTITPAIGKNYYWIGGSGQWTDPSHWATISGGTSNGCSVPGKLDNAIFDQNSFPSSSSRVVTLNSTTDIQINNMVFVSSSVRPYLNGSRRLYIYGDLSGQQPLDWHHNGEVWLYGSLELHANSYWYGGQWFRFKATTTGHDINTHNAYMRCHFHYDGPGGEWTLQSDFRNGNTNEGYTTYLQQGKLITNGHKAHFGYQFYSNYSNTRELDIEGSDISVNSIWDFQGSNKTLNSKNSHIEIDPGAGWHIYFRGGGLKYNDVTLDHNLNGNYYIYVQTDNNIFNNLRIEPYNQKQILVNGTNTYNSINTEVNTNNASYITNLTLSGQNDIGSFTLLSPGTQGPYVYLNESNDIGSFVSAGRGTRVYLGANKTQTVEDFTLLGTGSFPAFLYSTTTGTQATIHKDSGDVCFDFVWLQDIEATGNANFNAGASSSNLGNNSNWVFQSCVGYYWVGGTGNWSDTTHWATSSGGSQKHINPPTKFDNVYFDANSFASANQTVTVDVANPACANMNWQSAFFTPTFTQTTANNHIDVHGSLKLTNYMNMNYSGEWIFKGSVNNLSIDAASQTLNNVSFVGPGPTSPGGVWTLTSDLDVANTLKVSKGTFKTNSFNVNAKDFLINTTSVRGVDLDNSTITVSNSWNVDGSTGLTFDSDTSTIIVTGNSTQFDGSGQTYNDVEFIAPSGGMSSTLNDANTFNTVVVGQGVTLSLESGKTQTVNQLIADGTCNNDITINSTSSGNEGTISQSSGSVIANFVNLKDNKATGGASFSANLSTNNGNVTGWNFTAAPLLSVTVTGSNATCPTPNNGTASSTILGGKAPITYKWSTFETTDSISNLLPNTYWVEVEDSNGCVASDTLTITAPASYGYTVSTSGSNICNGAMDGTASITADSTAATPLTYTWSNAANGANISNLTAGTYAVTAVDANNCEATDQAVVTQSSAVVANASQTSNGCIASNVSFSVSTSGGSGSYTYAWNFGDGNTSTAASPVHQYASSGNYNATVTSTDANGCSGTDTIAMTIVYCNQAPNAVCANPTIYVGANCTATITAAQLDGGSSDPDGDPLTLSASNTGPFGIGTHTVTLTVTDSLGASSQCNSTITVADNTAPTASAQNVTVVLNSTGNGSTSASAVNNGSSDNCGVASLSLSQTNFDCSHVGTNPVVLTVTDNSGNSSTASATVTVVDNTAPIASAQNVTVVLDASGNGSTSASAVNNNSSDACGIASTTLSKTAFTCADVGSNAVVLSVNDNNGNSSTANAIVTVVDNIAPSVGTNNLTVYLDASGNGSITASQVDNNSSDACGVSSLSLSNSSFNCSNVGSNTVVLTVTDNNGNSATGNATITVVDTVAPIASAQNATLALDASGNVTVLTANVDNGSSDACGFNMSVSPSSFNCSQVGNHTVTLTVTDNNGNSSTATSTVTIVDNTAPNAIAQNLTVHLDANGSASITAGDVDNGSNDNCANVTLAISNSNFSCSDAGSNSVTLTVTDDNGNSSTANSIVTVVDTTSPNVVAKNITVSLNALGQASASGADINNGSTDNCGISSLRCFSTFSGGSTSGQTNVMNGTFTGGSAKVVEVTAGNGATNYRGSSLGTSCGQTWYPNGTLCDEGATKNSADSLYRPQNHAGATWRNNYVNSSYGILVVDLGSSQYVNAMSIFQMFSDGKATHVEAFAHSSSSASAPSSGASGWSQLFGYQAIGAGTRIGAYTTNPTKLSFNGVNTRYVKFHVKNDGSQGYASWIELSSVKLYSTNAPCDFNCASVGPNTVTLVAEDNSGNISSTTATITVQDNINPTAVAQNLNIALDATGNASITAAQVDNGSSDNCGIASLVVNPSSFTCNEVGNNTVTLTVTDDNGNTSTVNATVNVQDNLAPTAVAQNVTVYLDANGSASIAANDVDNGSNDNCGVTSLSLSTSSFNCSNASTSSSSSGSPTGLYFPSAYAVNGMDNNGSNFSTLVSGQGQYTSGVAYDISADRLYWIDASNKTLKSADRNGSNQSTLVSSGMSSPRDVAIDPDNGYVYFSDYGGQSIKRINTNGTGLVTLASGSGVQPLGIYLDRSNGKIYWADLGSGTIKSMNANGSGITTVVAGQSDCRDVSYDASTSTLYWTIGNQGAIKQKTGSGSVGNLVTGLTNPYGVFFNDGDGKVYFTETTGASRVSVINANGSGKTILKTGVTNPTYISVGQAGSSSASGVLTILTATDAAGNSDTAIAVVTVLDTLAPILSCNPDTLILDAFGNASNTVNDISTVSDNCSVSTHTASKTSFTTGDVGPNVVTVTATDASGNSSTCQANVFVVEPAPVAQCKNATLYLDASGHATLIPADVDDSSYSLVGISNRTVSQSIFDCSHVGTNAVQLVVWNSFGNSDTCTATVTVIDVVAPVASAQNVTVQLDATGNGSTTAAAVDNGSSDACGIASLALSQTAFDCSHVGANTVTLTVTDNNSNVSTTTATVTVVDAVAPVAAAQNVTVQLDATGNGSTTAAAVDNGSSDACGIASLALSQTAFDCSHVGANTVTLTVTDNNSNVSTTTASVTVVDAVAPVASAQNVTVQLDATGNGSTTAAAVDNGSSDACGIASLALSQTAFDCSHVGANTVTLTVTDNNNNVSTTTATVTVVDAVAPVASAQNVTVQLDATGNGSTTAAAVDNGSSDACGIASLALSQTAFDCSYVGANTVTLTVTDNNNNVSTTTATVTVVDAVAPVATAQNVTVQLDATGNGSTTAAAVDNGSSDACGIASLALSQTAFDCSHVGANTVTLTVTDNNNNVSTTTATVTVVDAVAPVATAQNVTVQLDATGNGSTTAAAVDNGSSDACGIASLALSQTAFDCSHVGANTVTLTVTDNNNNVSTTTATVTVVDAVAPVASAQNVTVQLDATGNGSTTAAAVDNGSSDACGIASLALSQTAFDCSHVGANTVTLTVTDNNNNVSTTTATVTVVDAIAPIASAQDITVTLDSKGTWSITPADVDNSSSDACGIDSLAVAPNYFTCADTGDNTVTLTAIDVNGNVSTTTSVVTVTGNADFSSSKLKTWAVDCYGNSTGKIQARMKGAGTSPYSYLWNTGSTKRTLKKIPAGVYTVNVLDSNYCWHTMTDTVTEPPLLVAAIASLPTVNYNTVAFGTGAHVVMGYGTNTSVSLNGSATGGTPGYTYSWAPATNLSSASVANPVFTPTLDADSCHTYTFTLTVTDANGCTSIKTVDVNVANVQYRQYCSHSTCNHKHQKGKGHHSHGKGHGYGHYKCKKKNDFVMMCYTKTYYPCKGDNDDDDDDDDDNGKGKGDSDDDDDGKGKGKGKKKHGKYGKYGKKGKKKNCDPIVKYYTKKVKAKDVYKYIKKGYKLGSCNSNCGNGNSTKSGGEEDYFSQDMSMDREPELFPNPNDGVFFLEIFDINEGEQVRIHIMDQIGKTILDVDAEDQGGFASLSIDMNEYAKIESGYYILRILVGDRVYHKRINVTH